MAPLARAQAPTRAPEAPARVYGIELEALADRERVLIFAEKPLAYEVEAPAPGRMVLVLREALLDPSAPTRVLPTVEGAVRELSAREHLESGAPEVRVEIVHHLQGPARVSQRGAILAVEFDRPKPVLDQEFSLNFEDAELGEILEAVVRETGERFVIGEPLEGRVTIAVPGGVSRSEALELLDAALFLRGYAAIPGPGGYRQVIRVAQLASRAPWTTESLRAGAEGPVATLVRLERADPNTVVAALRETLGSTGLAIPLDRSGSVLLAGSEGQIRRWVFLAQSLDRASPDELRLLRVRHRPVEEVASLLEELFRSEAGRGEPFEVWSDARSNTLVVRTVPARFDVLREWLRDLDQPEEGWGNVEVLPIEHVDPEGLAELLRNLVSDAAPVTGVDGGAARAASTLVGRPLTVAVHRPTHSLVVESDPATLELVREVVGALDRRLSQVLVEAIVSEVTMGDDLELGFDFAVTLGDPDGVGDDFIRVSSITREGGLVTPEQSDVDFAARVKHKEIVVPIVGPNGQTVDVLVPLQQAQIVAAKSEVGSRTVMRPTFVAASGEEQVFFAGDNIPLPTGTNQEGTNQAGAEALTLTTQIDRQDVGLELRVRPSVGEAGGVALETEILLSRVNPELTAALLGRPVPSQPLPGVDRQGIEEIGTALSQRQISTTARLRDGESAVIGFLVEEVDQRIERGAPFLRKLPILGTLFRNDQDRKFRRYFIVALSTTILRDRGDHFAATLRTRLAFQRSLARVNDLRRGEGATYAVLITTRPSPEQVASVARQLELRPNERVEITRWEWAGDVRYDVYVTGFSSLARASAAANRLSRSGWRPEVVALPSLEPTDSDDDASDPPPAGAGIPSSTRAGAAAM